MTGADVAMGSDPRPPQLDTAALLLQKTPSIPPSMICNDIYALFSRDPQLHSLPIVAGDQPVGLINRHILVEQYSKLYFRDLYGRHAVSTIMESNPLIVDIGMSLDDLSRVLVEDDGKFLYDGFIITEQTRYAGMGRARDLMAELARRKQAHLYSSLSYLRNFSFDVLKIDRSFIHDITSSDRDWAIARAILGLARNLRLKVVAEGVEEAEQLELLRSGGCELIQGYLISPAVPPEQIESIAARGPIPLDARMPAAPR